MNALIISLMLVVVVLGVVGIVVGIAAAHDPYAGLDKKTARRLKREGRLPGPRFKK